MNSTDLLREQVRTSVLSASPKALRMVQAILEIDADEAASLTLPESVREDVRVAFEESAAGLGRSHAEVMQQYRQWLQK